MEKKKLKMVLVFSKLFIQKSQRHENYGDGHSQSFGYFEESDIQLIGLRESTVQWVDYDMDGDLDLFMTGIDVLNII